MHKVNFRENTEYKKYKKIQNAEHPASSILCSMQPLTLFQEVLVCAEIDASLACFRIGSPFYTRPHTAIPFTGIISVTFPVFDHMQKPGLMKIVVDLMHIFNNFLNAFLLHVHCTLYNYNNNYNCTYDGKREMSMI